jgi:Tfp pilus assembly protein PilX
MNKDLNKKYKGLGFAEALIAMMIVGIVGIVLMQIASNTLRELAQLDIEDALAKHAVSTAVDLQRIAIEDMRREGDEKKFNLIQDNCYGIKPDGAEFSGLFDCPSEDNNNGGSDRQNYTRIYEDKNGNGTLDDDEQTQYFRIINVKNINERRAVVEIITGVADMKGLRTTNKDIKDYRYLVVIAR